MTGPIDARGVPANACPVCGNRILVVHAVFDDYDIAGWLLDAVCAACGTLVTAPCPPDRPDGYWDPDRCDPDNSGY